ncbi:MAG TPA: prepilin-type N-terminal cleavage/methylation domain-containing protein [Pyrinomonadaceae bacterium]|nr:prepilin-type N-terminal cleavage/methylation domain-containing protein [Pyrinomonadaceae bacterium]
MRKSTPSQKGFSLIELLIVVAIIGVIAAIAVPYLEQARQATKSASAVTSLRTINSAQASYRSTNGRYGTLAELGTAKLIADQSLVSGEKSGYTFDIPTSTALNYEAVADPVLDPSNAYQHYYIDATAIIRVEVGAAATIASPPVD